MADGARGIYGKLTAQADFARWNAGDFSRAGLDAWFEEGNGALAAARARLPAEPVCFCLPVPHAAFIGVFVASTDAVGRSFPLVLVERVALSDLGVYSQVPSAYGDFLAAGAACLEDGRAGTLADLVARVAELPAVSPGLDGQDTEGALGETSVADLASGVGELSRGGAYALRTFFTACDQANKGTAAGKPVSLTVDAPAPTPTTCLFWLELARRWLRPRAEVPSFFWTPRGNRLLVGLGAPAPATLLYLGNPQHKAARLWPLRTDVPAAIDAAVAALTADQKEVLSAPEASLGGLLWVFAEEGFH